jgi:hypothetical protein
MNIHKCEQMLADHPNVPQDVNCNGSNVDEIEFSDGRWWMIINGWEYAITVNYCPFCGKELTHPNQD